MPRLPSPATLKLIPMKISRKNLVISAPGLAALLGMLVVSPTYAVDFNWTNGTGDMNWFTPDNWTPVGPPAGGDGNFARFIAGASSPANLAGDAAPVQDYLFGNDGTTGSRTLNHTAGVGTVNGWVRMGIDPDGGGPLTGAGDAGTYNLSGTAVLNAGRLNMAEVGGSISTFNQSGGTVTINAAGGDNNISIGQGGIANFTISDGVFRQADVGDVGNGDGTWNSFGQNGGSTANFTMSGGTLSLDARTFFGRGGTITGNQTGGLIEVRRGEIVFGDGGGGTYTISGGTLLASSQLDNDDTGGNITVGQWDNSNATVNVRDLANVTTFRDLNIGNGRIEAPSTGVVDQSGGTVTVGRNLNIANGNTSQNGTYNLQGGVLDMTGGDINKGADDTFSMTGGRLQDALNVNFALDQIGGVLAPGPVGSVGITNIATGYTLQLAATLEIDLLTASLFDFLTVNGDVSLAGNLDLLPSVNLAVNDTFIIINNFTGNPTSGAFDGKPQGATFVEDGYEFVVDYAAGDGNDVAVTVTNVVPEPASLAILLGGVGLLSALRRRRLS